MVCDSNLGLYQSTAIEVTLTSAVFYHDAGAAITATNLVLKPYE
jgi:hypothetical protein